MDEGHNPLSIAAHMKGLVLYRNSFGYSLGCKEINQESLKYLKGIVPHLPHLKHLSWQIGLIPDDLDVLPLFQKHPNIHSVNFYVGNYWNNPLDTGELV